MSGTKTMANLKPLGMGKRGEDMPPEFFQGGQTASISNLPTGGAQNSGKSKAHEDGQSKP